MEVRLDKDGTVIAWRARPDQYPDCCKPKDCKWVCGCVVRWTEAPNNHISIYFSVNCKHDNAEPMNFIVPMSLKDTSLGLTLLEYFRKYGNQNYWCLEICVDVNRKVVQWKATPEKYPDCCKEEPKWLCGCVIEVKIPKFESPKRTRTVRARMRSLSPRKQSERTLKEKPLENVIQTTAVTDIVKLDAQPEVVYEPKSPSKFKEVDEHLHRSPITSASNIFFDANEWLNHIGAQVKTDERISSSVKTLQLRKSPSSSNQVLSPESNISLNKVKSQKQNPLQRHESIHLPKQEILFLDDSSIMKFPSSNRSASPVKEKRPTKHSPKAFSDITVRNKVSNHDPSANGFPKSQYSTNALSDTACKINLSPKKAIRQLHSRSSSSTTFNSKSSKSLVNKDLSIPISPTKVFNNIDNLDSSLSANNTPKMPDKSKQRREKNVSPSRISGVRSRRSILDDESHQSSPRKNRDNAVDNAQFEMKNIPPSNQIPVIASPLKVQSRRQLKSGDFQVLKSPERLRLLQSPDKRRHSSHLDSCGLSDDANKIKTRSFRTMMNVGTKEIILSSPLTSPKRNLDLRNDDCCQSDEKIEMNESHNDQNLSKRLLGKHNANPRRRLSIQSGRSTLSLMSLSAVTPVKPGDSAVYRKAKSSRRVSLNSAALVENTIKTTEEFAAYYSSDDVKSKPENEQRSPNRQEDINETESAEESKLPFGIPRIITIPDDFEFSD